jgi:multidrug efflux pump subunit AcrA (membrane-fusion protein)
VANVITSLVQDVLQLPNRAIQDEDGKKFVYVMGANGLRQIYVQIGRSSDTASEIISSELRQGDEILVNVPDDFPMMGPRRIMSSGGD